MTTAQQKASFVKSLDYTSSKGARTIQFIKTTITSQPAGLADVCDQKVITLKQSCIGKSASIAIERRTQDKDGVFVFAGNSYAGIDLEPDEWQQIIIAMRGLAR